MSINVPDITLFIAPYTLISFPLIGVAYIESYLIKNNFSVDILDLSNLVQTNNDKIKEFNMGDRRLWSTQENAVKNFKILLNNTYFKSLLDIKSKVIGFSVFLSNKYLSIEIAKYIKNNDHEKIIVFGGPDCFITEWCRDINNLSCGCIDLFVTGEGEEPLKQLLTKLKDKLKFDDIPDTIFVGTTFKINLKRDEDGNLDDLPFPVYKNFRKYKYTTQSLPLLFSRGCISKCIFCDVNRYWKKFRQRTPENLFSEIKFHLMSNNVRQFFFCDSLINADITKLIEFCGLIINNNIDIEMYGIGVAKDYMTLDVMKKLKKAGFTEFEFGIESGSQNVISNMKKLHKEKDIRFVLKNTFEAGIKCNIDLIAGFPMESEEDFLVTCDMLKNNAEYISKVVGLDVCHIGKDRAVEYKLIDRFGLVYYNKENDNDWTDRIGNNIIIRYQRKIKLFRIIRKYGIKYVDVVYFNELTARKAVLNKFQILIEKCKDKFYEFFYKIIRNK
ncbi:radical SAM protein [Candidatus Dependentiae bacterium]|nr:radical SAM protein [Candidatus Dependentiae bacterium]